MRTAQQSQNLHDWLNIHWPTIKPETVDEGLQLWANHTQCGTIHCFGGHVAAHGSSKSQGYVLEECGPVLINEDGESIGFESGRVFFGIDGLYYARAFTAGFDARHRNLTDHELVSARLKWAIDHPEAEVLA